MKEPLIASFFDHKRQNRDRYDFRDLNLPAPLSHSLRGAFIDLTGHYLRTSRRQAWRSLRKFAQFLTTNKTPKIGDSNRRNLLSEFESHLRAQPTMQRTSISHFNFVSKMIIWLSENSESKLWRVQIHSVHNFHREPLSTRANDIGSFDLARIVAACKSDIAYWIDLFEVRVALEKGGIPSHANLSSSEVKKLSKLIELEKEGIWTQVHLARIHWQGLSGTNLRKLASFRELTTSSALPFYVLLIVMTAGNPMSIMELPTLCIGDHPTDASRAFLDWGKERSNKEQTLPFLRSGRYSVPRLVELLNKMTASIRPLAIEADEGLLFITRYGDRANRLSVQGLHNALDKFRTKHSLPHFTFADLRKAVSALVDKTEEYRSSVPRLLQHENSKTSSIYLRGREPVERRYERLVAFQGEFISEAMISSSRGKKDIQYQTMFGLSCSDPHEGIADGSLAGKPCVSFTHCAVCPNAIVIHDDPRYIARILKARDGLLEAKDRSTYFAEASSRFSAMYQKTLTIIENDILSRVSSSVLNAAKEICSELPPIPFLD